MKFRLVESDIEDIIYVDDETGKQYKYENGQYVELPQGGDGGQGGKEKEDKGENQPQRPGKGKGDGKEDKGPQIGGEGDKDFQAKEQAKRDSEDVTKRDAEAEAARLERIKKLFDDPSMADKVDMENMSAIQKYVQQKLNRESDRFKNSAIQKFEASISNFIKNEVQREKSSTWSKFNKTYANSGIIRPGSRRQETGHIPSINVYFDQSGSWYASDIVIGEQAIGVLNNYVRRGEIKMNVYYFNDEVFTTPLKEGEGGTRGTPVLKHIQETKPDNVIVMTDSDIKDCKASVQVPGAVWFLWHKAKSQNLRDHLSGKKETKEFMLE